jgi:hypothetical protein
VIHAQGDDERAWALLREGLTLLTKERNRHYLAENLEITAGLAAGKGQPERATRLLGAADALRESIGAPRPPGTRANYERAVAAAGAQLDKATFATAWEAGRMMTLEHAIAFALDETDSIS